MKTNSFMNVSVSKEQHAFAKSARFPKIQSYTKDLRPETYNKLTDFDVTVTKGRGKERHSFGARLDRFHYSPTVQRQGTVGPANYKSPDCFSPLANSERTSRFTFGVARMSMKKSFIEQSQHLSTLGPAPDTYKDPPKFGSIGKKPAIRPRLNRYGARADDYSDFYRTQQSKLPGPGFYKSFDVTGGVIPDASIKTCRQTKFSKASDRWTAPTAQQASPPPSQYTPKNGMLEDVDASKSRAPVAKFAHSKACAVDAHF